MAKVSIIIPTYGDRAYDLLQPCLESIRKYTDESDCEVIVVANGCTDSTRTVVTGFYPYRLEWHAGALGYTKACNIGMKLAKGDYIVLLNNDTVLLEQPKNRWIEILLRAFWDEKMAVAGPMMQWCPWAEHDFLIGFCTMFRRSIVEELGYYDETFEAYGEDCDICVRAIQKGYRITQVPDSEIKRSPENPNIGIGYFPLYHAGNQSYANWPGGEELLRKNRSILHERYGTNISRAHNCDGWINDEELRFLAQAARKLGTDSVIIEVGSWHAKSTRALADNMPDDCVLYAVDTWQGSKVEQETNHASAKLMDGDHAYDEFCRNIWDHIQSGRVIPLRMHGVHAARLLLDMGVKAQFIFLDGGHSKGETLTDIALYLPLLAHGGTISGHDYINGMWPDVTTEVKEVFGKYIGNPPNTTIWYTDSKPKPKIYDCFIFNNEHEILEKRLRQLYDVVDRFVIVEATKTHSGKTKGMNFDTSKFRNVPWLNKITYIVVDDMPEVEGTVTDKSWSRERHQRDAILRGLTDCRDNDIIIISDCDEIPSPTAIQSYNGTNDIRSLEMDLFYYNHDTKAKDKWREAKIAPYRKVKELTPCGVRYAQADPIPNGGEHLSYFGGVQQIIQKLNDTAHVEYSTEFYKDPDRIQKAIEEKRDLFDRNYVKFQ